MDGVVLSGLKIRAGDSGQVHHPDLSTHLLVILPPFITMMEFLMASFDIEWSYIGSMIDHFSSNVRQRLRIE